MQKCIILFIFQQTILVNDVTTAHWLLRARYFSVCLLIPAGLISQRRDPT